MASELAVYSAVQKLLQPSETIKFAAEVLEAPSHEVRDPPATLRERTAARRYLAVISNVATGSEEAALLVFRRPTSPLIAAIIPIYASFQLSISQTSSPTSRTRFLVTFGAPNSSRFSVLAEDITSLADLIAEVKRLQEIARAGDWKEGGSTHAWIGAYAVHDGTLDSQTMARFDSISSAYSMRISSPLALRTGLSSIDWASTSQDPLLSPSASASAAAEAERGRWIVAQIQEREEVFTTAEEVKIWCGTFNVNDKLPSGSLEDWVAGSEGAELLVFGFQEFDLSTEAMVRYSSLREDLWREAIEKALGPRAEQYEKLHSRQLVGALIVIYVLKTSAKHVSSVSSNSVATGILGLMANKGATAIRLRYKDSYLTFVNSHLAAFAQMTEKRNQEVRDIGRAMAFPVDETGRDPWTPNLRPEVERVEASLGIFDSHHLVWIGDLNYRIDLPRSDVLRMVESQQFEMLQRFDQLKIQKLHGLAWSDFEEGIIAFSPSYKFDRGTQEYDTSEKQRTPSWTDRILWLSVHEGTTRALSYASHPGIGLSDHKPVSALLGVQVHTIVKEKRLEVQQEVMAELDQYDNDSLPDVKILPGPAVQFDEAIQYLQPQTKQIEVHNIGSVIAQWAFVLKPGTTTLCEPWLHVSPTSGLILPGETSLVNLTINVDNRTASSLNFSSDPPSDLLVLSIEKKDLFLAVAAREYRPTCFGNELGRLVRLGKPIRGASGEEREEIAKEGGGKEEEKRSVPREVWRMLDFLAEYGLEFEDVFLVPGDQGLVRSIRECLDTGNPFPLAQLVPPPEPALSPPPAERTRRDSDIGEISLSPPPPPRIRPFITSPRQHTTDDEDAGPNIGIHSMADSLLRFLDSLAEPVITFSAYSRALRVEKRADAYRVIESLPAINANTLLYLIAFLRVLVARTLDQEERAARIDRIAVVFSAVLMRPDPSATPDGLAPASIPRRRKAFVLCLMESEEVGK